MISEVLQVLNNANVNVASLNVTRSGVGATQSMMSFLALDDDVPINAIKALRSNPNLTNVAKIQLR